jgi:cell division septation protein DedD
MGFLAALTALSALSASSALAQTDPRLLEVVRQAQEGQGDSARIKVKRLLDTTSPTDTLYPEIIYTSAMVSGDAGDMRRQLQRIAVEYPSSSWADDALLRLVQLDYASGHLDGAARNLERIRADYPGTPLLPQASYWAARTYFDQKKPDLACRWVRDGIAAAQGNVEVQNQLGYLNQRCAKYAGPAGPRPDSGAAPRPDSSLATARPADSGKTFPAAADTTPPAGSVTVPVRPAPAPAPSRATPSPKTDTLRADSLAASPRTPSAGTRYRIQITAVSSRTSAESIASRIQARGIQPQITQEGGLYKVRVGDYATKADAAAALPGVKAKLGGNPFVVAGS